MSKENWYPINGRWEIKEEFKHLGNEGKNIFADSLLINKEKIIDGGIKAKLIFNTFKNPPSEDPPSEGPHSAAIVFRYQTPQNYYFAGIGGYGKKFVIGKRIPGGTYALSSYGISKEILKQEEYNLKLKISGRRFSLFLNGGSQNNSHPSKDIKVLDAVDTNEPFYDNGNIGLKVYDSEDVTFKDFSYEREDPICFVVMPFKDKKLNELRIYDEIIKKTVKRNKLKCRNSDEIFDINAIISDIIKYIESSLIIVAEITRDNANVFYELGIAHAKKSNVILICDRKRRKEIPFDIQHLRIIFYGSGRFRNRFNKEKLIDQLDKTIKSILEKTTDFSTQESLDIR